MEDPNASESSGGLAVLGIGKNHRRKAAMPMLQVLSLEGEGEGAAPHSDVGR